jgi:F-type H+-transporting ATPase subunit b
MDATLHALGQVLLGAIPTFLIVLILHFYLKAMLFKPLEKVLHERRKATEGAREAASLSLERAAQKAAEYEASLNAARNEIYREQEEVRRQWREDQAAKITGARKSAEGLAGEARTNLEKEAAEAKVGLEQQVRQLADEIAGKVLQVARR